MGAEPPHPGLDAEPPRRTMDAEPSASDRGIAGGIERSGFAIAPDFAPRATWTGLAAEARRLRAHGRFREAGVGRGASWRLQPEVRGDRVHWIEPERATRRQRAWLAQMEALRRALNRELLLGLFGFEAHLAVYPPGAFYRTHLDRFADASHRVVTAILYLNDAWREEDGGVLRLHPAGPGAAPRDVRPEGGTLVAFLAGELPHEVRPAARERWSLVGWFTGRP